MPKLKIKFLEKIHEKHPSTDTVRGYRRAIINDEKGLKTGRIIDPEELQKAESIDFLLFETEIDFSNQNLDLTPLLEADENGKAWLRKFNEISRHYYRELVPLNFSVEMVPFVPLEFCMFPNDYFERVKNGRHYQVPTAMINSLPEKAGFAYIVPPMKFKNGKWLKNLYYNRNIMRPDGEIESFAIKEPGEIGNFRGLVYGTIEEDDLTDVKGKFEGGFPVETFLNLCYPTEIRDATVINPLSISIYYCNDS